MPRNIHDIYHIWLYSILYIATGYTLIVTDSNNLMYNTVVYCLAIPTAMMQTLIPNFGYLGGICIRRVVSFQAQAPKDWAESWAEARLKLQVDVSKRVSCNVTYSCTLHTNGYLKVWHTFGHLHWGEASWKAVPRRCYVCSRNLFETDKETEGWAWWAWMSRYMQSLLYCICPNRKVVPSYVSNHRETLCHRNVLADEEVHNSWLQEVCPTHFVWC